MNGPSSSADGAIVGPDRVRNDFQDILRTAQRRGWTDEKLESLSGVNARTIKGYRIDGREPSASAALSICVTLGKWAMNVYLAAAGYQGAPLDEAEGMQPCAVVGDVARGLAVIAAAASDNRFDHTELPGVTDAADLIIETVFPLSRAGRAS
ncbi:MULTISPECIES: hypothetical protein [unclassified Sphingomonas]|uniref:hypothetical protein n=1 Tax=unclassified Sphingomonas TaxID=196159 RepID=UPI002269DDE2|nr:MULTISPECIES: hypothetical protein [unclassified Sphingomonas]